MTNELKPIAQADACLAWMDKARAMIAKTEDPGELVKIQRGASAWVACLKLAKAGYEVAADAEEVRLRAERKAGVVLAAREPMKPGPLPKDKSNDATYPLGLSDLGISKDESSRWQKMAGVAEERFQDYLAQARAARKDLTSKAVLDLARGIDLHFSSETPEWNTPPHIIAAVQDVFGGQIDLDPCSNSKTSPSVPATRHFSKEDDGLGQDWSGRVYMNPPYGKVIALWVEKLKAEHEEGQVAEAIALVPARTDTHWFRSLRLYSRCFVFGRLRFSESEAGAPFPSMAVYMGENEGVFASRFSDIGDTYKIIGDL